MLQQKGKSPDLLNKLNLFPQTLKLSRDAYGRSPKPDCQATSLLFCKKIQGY